MPRPFPKRPSGWRSKFILLLSALGVSSFVPASARESRETFSAGSNPQRPVQNSMDVWSTILDNPDKSPLTGDPDKPKVSLAVGITQRQEEQTICMGGRCNDGGLMGMTTDKIFDGVCGKELSGLEFCKQRDDSVKRCAYAAQIFAIPSSALLCMESAKLQNPTPPDLPKAELTNAMTDKQKNVQWEHLKRAHEKYEKLIKGPAKGGKGSKEGKDQDIEGKSADGVCYVVAQKARNYIDLVTEKYWNSNFLKSSETTCDYNKLIALIVVAERLGPNQANVLLQVGEDGSKLTGAALQQMKPIIDSVLKCMGKLAHEAVNAPENMAQGSCKNGDSIYN